MLRNLSTCFCRDSSWATKSAWWILSVHIASDKRCMRSFSNSWKRNSCSSIDKVAARPLKWAKSVISRGKSWDGSNPRRRHPSANTLSCSLLARMRGFAARIKACWRSLYVTLPSLILRENARTLEYFFFGYTERGQDPCYNMKHGSSKYKQGQTNCRYL